MRARAGFAAAERTATLLRPFRTADLPPVPTSFWKLVGPGAVLVGLSIGAGELIIWPRVTAQYGAGMVWAALLGVFLQMWLNIEIGRYTLATGESVYAGYARMAKVFAWVFLALNVLGWIVPGWARACGGALKVLVVGPDGWGSPGTWTAITFAGVAYVLFGPRLVYRSVERTTSTLVVLMTLGLLFVAFSVGSREVWAQLVRGIANFPRKHPEMPPYELFSAIVFAGAGGTANLFYCFYLLDKGWGMGAHVPAIVNPLRKREQKSPEGGYRVRPTGENLERWRGWFRSLVRDQVCFFWLLNSFTILLFILGALAVLHPRGIVPTQDLLVWEEAVILGASWGKAGSYLFLLVGVACLFSTQLTLVDGVARSCADILHANFAWAHRVPLGTLYGGIAGFWILAGIVLTYLYEHLPAILFLLSAGFFGGIAMAIYAPLTLVLNRRFLPEPLRPGPLRTAAVGAVAAFYVAFAGISVFQLVRRFVL
ncbi:MAG: iron transporter [Candidatus Binatia bacterium]|nr:MAG: iron transporter [Candidatus Binatia bacterium]